MRGYLNRHDLNTSKLFEYRGQRAFRTGDWGEIHGNGLIFCRGRIDDQIKLNGFRIELADIDSALQRLNGVSQAAAVALRRQDGAAGRLIGFVIAEQAVDQTIASEFVAACKAGLAELLPAYMIPSEILIVDSLPLSMNHKVDRKKMAELYQTSRQ